MNEIAFLRSTSLVRSGYGAETPQFPVLFPFGRGNNGWRFAGERDVFEALGDVKKRFKVDDDRIVLRGFSMGGHGAWHLGTAGPVEIGDRVTVVGPRERRKALSHLFDRHYRCESRASSFIQSERHSGRLRS